MESSSGIERGTVPGIICLGDSLTAGNPGHSFIKYMRPERRCVNRGLGGATLRGLLERIDGNLFRDAAAVIIEIGANDLLLPYMHSARPQWRDFVETIYRNGMRPCESPESFEESYRSLLRKTLGEADRVVCVGIPALGEQRESALNRAVEEHGRIIERVARGEGVGFVDFAAWERRAMGGSAYLLGETPDSLTADALASRDGNLETALCRQRGLEITVDGVHLNIKGAAKLAAMIEEEL